MELTRLVLASVVSVAIVLTVVTLLRPYIDFSKGFEGIAAIVGAIIPFALSAWEKYLNSVGGNSKEIDAILQTKMESVIKSIDDIHRRLDNQLDRINESENRTNRIELLIGSSDLPEQKEGIRIVEKNSELLVIKQANYEARLSQLEQELMTLKMEKPTDLAE